MEDKEQKIYKKDTTRIYFDDACKTEFEAQVIGRLTCENRPAVILDRTCFYPESGGQPSDKGTINGVEVTKVVEEGERIIHVLKANIPVDRITGKIDWPTRFDHMQQHSGQHILSQSFFEIMGGKTLSFHLGAEFSTVEIGLQKIAEEDMERVEQRANAVVFEDREIKTYFIPQEKISEIPLRKPPKKEGLIRVVEVSGFDYSACGGTHCRRAGEVGLIKITKGERIRNNIRFEFVCGGRALADYSLKNRVVRQLSNQFSGSEKDVLAAVEKLTLELKNFKKSTKKLEERLAQYEAQEYIKRAEGRMIKSILSEKTPEAARYLALNIIKQGEHAVLFGLKTQERSHLILACSESLKLDMRELIPIISPLINARGGGSPSLVELAADLTADLVHSLNKALEFVSHKL